MIRKLVIAVVYGFSMTAVYFIAAVGFNLLLPKVFGPPDAGDLGLCFFVITVLVSLFNMNKPDTKK